MNWRKWIEEEKEKSYFIELRDRYKEAISKGIEIYPARERIFHAFSLTPWEETKVVIIGQDPYHTPGMANGLAFSVPRGKAPPPSLRNIYRLLEIDDPTFHRPSHGDLSGWAHQGVLLLNTILTVERGKPMSHESWGWRDFTNQVLEKLTCHNNNLIFLLWGAAAISKRSMLEGHGHHIVTSVHPSPLSAHRGFLNSNNFKTVNELIAKAGLDRIDWNL